jgi:hemerythrin-like domain-containing protein
MNAIDLLEQDHVRLRELLSELERSTDRAHKKRGELLEEVALELDVHTAIEEELFYPAFRDAGETQADQKRFYSAIEEHRAVQEFVLPDLQETEVTSELFAARAKLLRDLVLHHVDEEEKELFPRAKQLLSSEELEELGGRLQERRSELHAAGEH